jgi:hypothetical protein
MVVTVILFQLVQLLDLAVAVQLVVADLQVAVLQEMAAALAAIPVAPVEQMLQWAAAEQADMLSTASRAAPAEGLA